MARALHIVAAVSIGIASASAAGATSAQMSPSTGDAPVAAPQRPNVIVLIADDLGYGDLGCYGSPLIDTPHIDALAAGGARFTAFYAHPACSPSRAALMTGRYAPRVGIGGPLGSWSQTGLAPDETTVAEVLRGVGYRTAHFGKWHLGDSPDQQATAQGFDEFAGLLWGPTGLPLVWSDSRDGSEEYEPDQRYDTLRVTRATLDFIDRDDPNGPPFFCVVSFTTPHEPATASPGFVGRSADGRGYGDSVEEMDASIGAIVQRLAERGIDDETLVVFLSDNGGTTTRDPYQNASNGPLYGSKGTTWEGGVRVPVVAHLPGAIPAGGVVDDVTCITDLLPTLAALAGASLDSGVALDGVDITGILRGAAGDPERAVHMTRGFEVEAVRIGRYKLRMGELYDVTSDPGERFDLAALLPAEAQRLATELDRFRAELAETSRPAGRSSRVQSRWRGGLGHTTPLEPGQTWKAITEDRTPLFLEDADDEAELEVVNIGGEGNISLPSQAHRLPRPSSDVRWVRRGMQLDPGGPFSIAFWYRGVVDDPSEDVAILDVGGARAGLSVTLGNAGELGDDAAPGRRDDLLVRIGGSGSPSSGTVAVDLPGDTAARFAHVVLTFDGAGDLTLHLDGFEVARVTVPEVAWNPGGPWALFAPFGRLGGEGGDGVLPFAATRSMGEIAGFGVWDRPLRRNEVEAQYCRYVLYPYCTGGENSNGTDARLGFSGSFDPSDERLTAHVEGAAPGSFGFLVVGRHQGRQPVGAGRLCLGAPFLRLSNQVFGFDASGAGGGLLDWSLVPSAFDPETVPTWNFQCWYRDGATSNFSNAVTVLFCR